MTFAPKIGATVLYTLSEADAAAINKRRDDAGNNPAVAQAGIGVQIHVGNRAYAGDVYPATIVRVFPMFGDSRPHCNLKVLLDGNDDLWVTSVRQHTDHGTFEPDTSEVVALEPCNAQAPRAA